MNTNTEQFAGAYPGDYALDDELPPNDRSVICRVNDIPISAAIHFGDLNNERDRATARLIAAAPSLLAQRDACLKALKAMKDTHGMHGPCRQHGCNKCKAAYESARAAIALCEKEEA